MDSVRGFVAYPSRPAEIGGVLKSAIASLQTQHGLPGFHTWEENDVAGRFVVDPILQQIDDAEILVADITRLNFNVAYEVGYAIGRQKRLFLTRYTALKSDDPLIREVGIFDTLGYESYEHSGDLAAKLAQGIDRRPLEFDSDAVRTAAPLYVISPKHRTDTEIRLIARIKKARLNFRTFDPEEQGRMSAPATIDSVAASHGVVVPLLPKERDDAVVHNLRAAFVAGLSEGMRKQLLIIQAGYDPVPLDYRDLVQSYVQLSQIDEYVAEFASTITGRLQESSKAVVHEPKAFLARLSLGASAAENEMRELGQYYLETDEYRRARRGEIQIVSGRKGAGKTALFAQLRDRVRENRQKIVLDLKPEGFQLLKFKELLLDRLEAGTKEHTITAFWEYVLLLEICHKILEKDREPHRRNSDLYHPYQSLAAEYENDEYVVEGDFAERMLKLTARISNDFRSVGIGDGELRRLDDAGLTELLYKHDVAQLRRKVEEYLTRKDGLWVLFDNLDKGWPPHGVQPHDLTMLRCLLDAIAKLSRSLRRAEVECHGIMFIRNDVYELLVESTPDRGKFARANIDWTDPDLLRELLRRRISHLEVVGDPPFADLWAQICVSHVGGEESSQYMIERSLMRPRNLIDLVHLCRSHAVNLGKEKIDLDDIRRGEEAYSTELVSNVSFEIRDVYPRAEEVLYQFLESPCALTRAQTNEHLAQTGLAPEERTELLDILLWYGVLGVVRSDGDVAYIYSVNYDIKRLKALSSKKPADSATFFVNPAFWAGLEIKHD